MYDMKTIVGTHDIVFIVLDTLRYDVAQEELAKGNVGNIGKYMPAGRWEKRHSPGNFTYPAHHAFFTGFLPVPVDYPKNHKRLFAVSFPGRDAIGEGTYIFHTKDIISGFASTGYRTICVGGVGFFNTMTPLGSVFPSLFEESYWNENTGVTCPDSTEHQITYVIEKLQEYSPGKRIFLYLNVSAIHQPNYFYDPSIHDKTDTIKSHAAALRYVDGRIGVLFDVMRERGPVFYIICSDHGTLYGEDGLYGHRISHELVWTVPYTEFVVERNHPGGDS